VHVGSSSTRFLWPAQDEGNKRELLRLLLEYLISIIENIFAFACQDLSSFVLVQLNMFLSLVSLGSLCFSFSDFMILFLVLTFYNHFLNVYLISLQGKVDKYMFFWTCLMDIRVP